MKKLYALLVVILVGAFIVGGCSSTTSSSTQVASTPAITSQTTQITTPAAPTPKRGGVFKIGFDSDGEHLYPVLAAKSTDHLYMAPALETLTHLGKLGPDPWLAASWDVSPDQKSYTLHLQKGVTFHDGTAFNADACKWNLDNFHNAGRTELTEVTSVDKVDDSTVRINLSVPDNMILTYLAGWAGYMISPTAFNANGKEWSDTHMVGTGAFKFVSWQRSIGMKYEKFDGYWQKGKPYLDGVEIDIISDLQVMLASFERGEIQAAIRLNLQDVKSLETSGKYNFTVSKDMFMGMTFDVGRQGSIFTDIKLRQAVNYGVDQKALADALGFGYIVPTNQVCGPDNWGYNPNVVGYPYNPEKAKQLLSEAGYPNGLNIQMTTGPTAVFNNLFTAVQAQLLKSGINAKINIVDFGRFGQITLGGGWEDLMTRIVQRELNDDVYSLDLLSSKAAVLVQSLHPKELDDLIAQARMSPDFQGKQKAVQEAMKVVTDQYAVLVPFWIYPTIVVTSKSVHDDGLYKIAPYRSTLQDTWME